MKRLRRMRLLPLFMLCLCFLFPTAVRAAEKSAINVTLRRDPEKKTVHYRKGQKLQLVVNADAAVFTSSRPDVASVSKQGVVTTRKAGWATIRISSPKGKKRAKLHIHVTENSTAADLANRYGSRTNYFIRVNKTAHTVTILKKNKDEWTVFNRIPCCVGAPATPTPSGIFHTQEHGTYFVTDEGNKCWYYTRIYAGYLFHSQIYRYASSPSQLVDASMGVSCSHGCIRLHLKDAYWMYKNLPYGTTVYIS